MCISSGRSPHRRSIARMYGIRVEPTSAAAWRTLSASAGRPVGSISPDTFPLLRKQHDNLKLASRLQRISFHRTWSSRIPPDRSRMQCKLSIRSGRSAGLSNQVRVPLAPTLPPPDDFRVEVTPEGIVLTWSCVEPTKALPDITYRYRIYRRSVEKKTDLRLGDVDCPPPRFEDHTFEWQKAYEYRIAVLTLLGEEKPVVVEGDDSPVQKVFANDIYPPEVPSGLQAVFSGPGQATFCGSALGARHRCRPRGVQRVSP